MIDPRFQSNVFFQCESREECDTADLRSTSHITSGPDRRPGYSQPWLPASSRATQSSGLPGRLRGRNRKRYPFHPMNLALQEQPVGRRVTRASIRRPP